MPMWRKLFRAKVMKNKEIKQQHDTQLVKNIASPPFLFLNSAPPTFKQYVISLTTPLTPHTYPPPPSISPPIHIPLPLTIFPMPHLTSHTIHIAKPIPSLTVLQFLAQVLSYQ